MPDASSELSQSEYTASSGSDYEEDTKKSKKSAESRKTRRGGKKATEQRDNAFQQSPQQQNPLFPFIEVKDTAAKLYTERAQLLLQELNLRLNGIAFAFPSIEEEQRSAIKRASNGELLDALIQLVQKRGVAIQLMDEGYYMLTNIVLQDLKRKSFPFELPGDEQLLVFLRVLRAMGYRSVALSGKFIDSKIGVLVNYIALYDPACIDSITQRLAHEVLLGLRDVFENKKEDENVFERVGLEYDEAQEKGVTAQERLDEYNRIDYQRPSGEAARAAKLIMAQSDDAQKAIEASKKMK